MLLPGRHYRLRAEYEDGVGSYEDRLAMDEPLHGRPPRRYSAPTHMLGARAIGGQLGADAPASEVLLLPVNADPMGALPLPSAASITGGLEAGGA